MKLFVVDAVIGTKYYAIIEGRVRECFFLGTKGVLKNGETECFYLLDVAGIGRTTLLFDEEEKNFRQWWNGHSFYSILAESVDNLIDGIFVTARYGAIYNPNNADMYHEYLPELALEISFCCPCAYTWDKTRLRPKQINLSWNYWQIDTDGFHCDIDTTDLFPTKQSCKDAHADEYEPVTF